MSGEPKKTRRSPQIIAIAVLLAVAAGIVFLIVRGGEKQSDAPQAAPSSSAPAPPPPDNTAMVDPDRGKQIADTISGSVARAYTYDAKTLDEHLGKIGETFGGQAKSTLKSTTERVRGTDASVQTKATSAALLQEHGDQVQVLVALSEKISSGGKNKTFPARLLVDAKRHGVGWQVTGSDDKFAKAQPIPDAAGTVPADRGGLAPGAMAQQRDLALASAMRDAQVMYSVDYRDPEQSLRNTLAVTTGALRDQVQQSLAANAKKIADSKQTVVATPVSAGVATLDLTGGQAQVLVAVDTKSRAGDAKEQTQRTTALLTLKREGDRWLVGDLKQL